MFEKKKVNTDEYKLRINHTNGSYTTVRPEPLTDLILLQKMIKTIIKYKNKGRKTISINYTGRSHHVTTQVIFLDQVVDVSLINITKEKRNADK